MQALFFPATTRALRIFLSIPLKDVTEPEVELEAQE